MLQAGCALLGAVLVVQVAAIRPAAAQTEAFSSRSLAPDAAWQATRGAAAVSGLGLANAMGNPAALMGLTRSGVALSHLAWAGDLSREWIAVGSPVGSRLHVGVDAGLLHGEPLQGYDALGQETGSFSATEWNASSQVAAKVGGGFAVGLGVRYFRLEDPSEPIDGLGFSGGVRYAQASRSFGAAITDFGSADGSSSESFDLPSRWRIGVEQHLGGHASIAVSALGLSDQTRVLAAANYRPVPWLSLLGGVETGHGLNRDALGWSTGLSADRDGITASYAFSESSTLGALHQFGIEIPFRTNRDDWGHPNRR